MEKKPLPNKQFRLKKGEDESIFGPVPAAVLKEWADSAQVAPIDQIDENDEQWKLAPTMDFLEMVYEVKFVDGTAYGPTTLGTLRELLRENIVTEDSSITNILKKHSSPLGALLDAHDFSPKSETTPTATTTPTPPPLPIAAKTEENGSAVPVFVHPAVEMAKEQRIRQLEEDLRILRKEHDELLQKYRQLNQQVIESRAARK
jgi:hypothetical protein